MNSLRYLGLVLFAGAVMFSGCSPSLPPSKPLDQLTPEEAQGRQVFLGRCARCHRTDSSAGLNGPGLFGLYRKKYLRSGAPANDDRVSDIIEHGRGMMPAMGNTMDEEQLQALLAYLHTL
ncbi:MAG TPA: cytochrome c [Pseudacidobacterium sp.]|nr:cytochrome c [Pseudacidobacterium sp.]